MKAGFTAGQFNYNALVFVCIKKVAPALLYNLKFFIVQLTCVTVRHTLLLSHPYFPTWCCFNIVAFCNERKIMHGISHHLGKHLPQNTSILQTCVWMPIKATYIIEPINVVGSMYESSHSLLCTFHNLHSVNMLLRGRLSLIARLLSCWQFA